MGNATGGNGTGAGLGSQGAVAVSGDTLFAVNAGSDSISAFAVRDGALNLETTFASNGVRPISLTVHGNVLYVLNARGSGSITGFRLGGGAAATLRRSTARPSRSLAPTRRRSRSHPTGRHSS